MGRSVCNADTCPGFCVPVPGFKMRLPGKLFLSAVVLEAILLLAVCVAIILQPGDSHAAQYYGGIAIYTCVVLVLFTLDAVYTENAVQLYACLLTSVLMTTYVVYHGFQQSNNTFGPIWDDIRYYAVGVKLFFQVLYFVLAYFVRKSFDTYSFLVAGARADVQQMFKDFQVFLTALKVDFFLGLYSLALSKAFLFSTNDAEFIVGIVEIALKLPWTYFAWLSVVLENRSMALICFALAFLFPSYLIFMTVRIAYLASGHGDYNDKSGVGRPTIPQFIIAAVAGFVVRLLFLTVYLKVIKNFNHGLRRIVFEKQRHKHDTLQVNYGAGQHLLSPSGGV